MLRISTDSLADGSVEMLTDIHQTFGAVLDKLQGWLEALVIMLPNLVAAIVVVALFYLAAKLVGGLAGRVLDKASSRRSLQNLGVGIAKLAVLVVGLVVALNILKLEKAVLSVLAGVGVIGLAIGFAFQDIAANFMAGVLLLIRRPLKVGDIVESNGFFGEVDLINLRNTAIKTPDGQMVLIPNKEVFQSPLTNYSVTGERRVTLGVGVSYGEDLERVREVALDAVSRVEERDTDREVELYFTEFGDSSINLELRIWLRSPEQQEYFTTRSAAVTAIKAAFDERDITIPFPIRTLDFGIKGGAPLHTMLEVEGNGAQAASRRRAAS